MKHSREIQLVPAPDHEAVYLDEGDGLYHREPVIAWALRETWRCDREHCTGPTCHLLDEHEGYETIVVPLVWADDWRYDGGFVDTPASNQLIVPKGTTDDELRDRPRPDPPSRKKARP